MKNDIPFLKEKDNKVYYNEDDGSELVYYIPEDYFTDTKTPLAKVIGQYIEVVGIFDWALISANGKMSEFKIFKWPTMITCKPYKIEKIKDYKINGLKAKDYRALHFKYMDEAISDLDVPQILENAEIIFKALAINGGKIPPTIPYDKLQDYYMESMLLTGNRFNTNAQLFGILIRETSRDPRDISKLFIESNPSSMTGYEQIPISMAPKFTSPFTALTSKNWDESLMAAVLLSDQNEEDIKVSPLEKVVMS